MNSKGPGLIFEKLLKNGLDRRFIPRGRKPSRLRGTITRKWIFFRSFFRQCWSRI